MKDQLDKLIEFHRTFDAHFETAPTADLPEEVITIRIKLLQEELDEYVQAAQKQDLVEIADALTDLLYVLLGTYIAHGLQDFGEALFCEVHRSNMSKLDENGRPIHRDDGKVLKSRQFRAPDIQAVLSSASSRS